VNKETRNLIIVLAVAVMLLLGGYLGLKSYSGVQPPFTVINSGSMMHSSDSKIGIIDTGDMLVVRDPDKEGICTYVEGSKNGYTSFGEYGDVIVYKKPNQNIIHRAMIEIELTSKTSTSCIWHIPSLDGFDKWTVTNSSSYAEGSEYKDACWNPDTCEITLDSSRSGWYFWLTDVGYAHVNVPINLYDLAKHTDTGATGYLTKGDNGTTNTRFDQTSGIFQDTIVQKDIIKSVAIFEVPWLGAIKLYLNGNGSRVPSNTTVDLFLTIFAIIAFIVLIDVLINYASRRMAEKKSGKE
jgi:signal peptidase